MRFISKIAFLSIISSLSFSQMKFGDNPDVLAPSAIMEMESTKGGFLIPRLSTTQRTAMANPANGLIVYDSNEKTFFMRADGRWREIGLEGMSFYKSDGTLSSNRKVEIKATKGLYFTGGGNVGIGVSAPKDKLSIKGSFITNEFASNYSTGVVYPQDAVVFYKGRVYRKTTSSVSGGDPSVDVANWKGDVNPYTIYESNGSLSSSRIINMGTHNLSFGGAVNDKGKVGIGVSSPRSSLDVSSGFRANSFSSRWEANATYALGDLVLYNSGIYRNKTGSSNAVPSLDTVNWEHNITPNIYTTSSKLTSSRIVDIGAKNLVFPAKKGKMGIGTTSPRSLLDIQGGFRAEGFSSNWNGGNSYNRGDLVLYGSKFYGNKTGFPGNDPNSDTANWDQRVFPDVYILSGTISSPRVVNLGSHNLLFSTTTGKIGFGTTSPRSLLDVNGGFRATRFSTKYSSLQAYDPRELVIYNGVFYRAISGIAANDPSIDSSDWDANIAPNIYNESRSLLSSRVINMGTHNLTFPSTKGGISIGRISPRSALLDISGSFRAEDFSSKWNSVATYSIGELVIHNGSFYRSKTAVTGTDPSTDSVNWDSKVLPDVYINDGVLLSPRTLELGSNDLVFVKDITGAAGPVSIGVGRTNPVAALDISGTFRAYNSNARFSTNWDPTSTYLSKEIVLYNGSLYRAKKDVFGKTNPASNTADWDYNVSPNLYTNNDELTSPRAVGLGTHNLSFATTTGKMGIGTTSPRSKLDVSGVFRADGFSSKWNKTATYAIGDLVIYNPQINNAPVVYRSKTGVAGTNPETDSVNWDLKVFPDIYTGSGVLTSNRVIDIGANDVLFERTTGNIGIGTTDPRSLLDIVSGGFRAEGFSSKWEKNNTYTARDIIIYNSGIYRSLTGVSGNNPDLDTINWDQNIVPNVYIQDGDLLGKRTIDIRANNLSFSSTGGRMGIGVTSPRSLLDISGGFRAYGFSSKWSSTATYSVGEIVIYRAIVYKSRTGVTGNNPSAETNNWDSKVFPDMYLKNGSLKDHRTVNMEGHNLIFNSTTGKVGIGTTNPRSLLDIGGIFRVKGFSSGWDGSGRSRYDVKDVVIYNSIIYRNKAGRQGTSNPLDSRNWEYNVVPNVYFTDGTLSSNRVVDIADYNLIFTGNNRTRVGIGTTDPRSVLEVSSGAFRADGFSSKWKSITTYSTGDLVIYNSHFYKSKTGLAGVDPGKDTTNWSDDVFSNVYNSNETLLESRVVDLGAKSLSFLVTGNGGIGIGTTMPLRATLDVSGGVRTDQFASRWILGGVYNVGQIVIYDSNFYRSKTGVAGTNPLVDSVNWESNLAPNIYWTDGNLTSSRKVHMGDKNLLFLSTTGKIGIGATNPPRSLLDISGAFRADGFSNKWNSTATYAVGELVVYNGNFYRKKTGSSTSNPTSDTNNWEYRILPDVYTGNGAMLSSRIVDIGANNLSFTRNKGNIGIGTTTARVALDISDGGFRVDGFSSKWNSNTTYSVGDLVIYDSGFYKSKTGVAGIDPSLDTLNWEENLTPNIYREDGALQASRSIDLGSYNLVFSSTTGLMGIGTTNPRSLLEISGAFRADGFSSKWSSIATYSVGELVIYNTNFYRSKTGVSGTNPQNDSANWKYDVGTNFYKSSGSLSSTRVVGMGDKNLLFTRTTGNIGIGNTAPPRALLDVVGGGIRTEGFSSIWKSGDSYHKGDMVVYKSEIYANISSRNSTTEPDLDTANWYAFWSPSIYNVDGNLTSSRFVDMADKNIYFTTTTGKVGIGTTAARSSLDVSGDIFSSNFSTIWHSRSYYPIGSAILYDGDIFFKRTSSLTSQNPKTDKTNWLEYVYNTLYEEDGNLSDNRTIDLNGKDLYFTTSSANEKIGIGISKPLYTLHINGEISAPGFSPIWNRAKQTARVQYAYLENVGNDGGGWAYSIGGNPVRLNLYGDNRELKDPRTVDMKGKTINFHGGKVGVGNVNNNDLRGNLHVGGILRANGFSTSWDANSTYAISDLVIDKGGSYVNVTGHNDSAKHPGADKLNWAESTGITFFSANSALQNTRGDNTRHVNLATANSKLIFNISGHASIGIGTSTPKVALELAANAKDVASGILRTTSANAGFSTRWVAKNSSPVATAGQPQATGPGDYNKNDMVLYDGNIYINRTSVNDGSLSPPDDTVNWVLGLGGSIYASNGLLSGNRTIDMSGKSLEFKTNGGTISIGSTKTDADLNISGGIYAEGFSTSWEASNQYPLKHLVLLRGDFYRHITAANPNPPDRDTVNWKKIEETGQPSIYNTDGELKVNREFGLGGKKLVFSNPGNVQIGPSTIKPSTRFSIIGSTIPSESNKRTIAISENPIFYLPVVNKVAASTANNTAAESESFALGDGLTGIIPAATDNLFAGQGAGNLLFSGKANVVVGNNAAPLMGRGSENTIMGANAGAKLTSGSKNVLIGSGSGKLLTTGFGNIFLGHESGATASTAKNNIVIGDDKGLITNQSDWVVINPKGKDINSSASMVITDAGFVGIGTTAPNYLFEIKPLSRDWWGEKAIGFDNYYVISTSGPDKNSRTITLGNGEPQDFNKDITGSVYIGMASHLQRKAKNTTAVGRYATDSGTVIGTIENNTTIGAYAGDALRGGTNLLFAGAHVGGSLGNYNLGNGAVLIGNDSGYAKGMLQGNIKDINGNTISFSKAILLSDGSDTSNALVGGARSRKIVLITNDTNALTTIPAPPGGTTTPPTTPPPTTPALPVSPFSIAIGSDVTDAGFMVNVAGTARSTARITASDKRIKKDISASDSALDSEVLNRVRVTDYRLIDTIFGNKMHKKLIAQQLKAIYPQAVTESYGYIPNIYSRPKQVKRLAGDEVLLSFSKKLDTNCVVGSRVKLTATIGGDYYATIKSVKGDKMIVSEVPEDKDVKFVYGVGVNDFLSVDYDAIAMLKISSTQELHKRINALKADRAAMRLEIEKLKQKALTVEERTKLKSILSGTQKSTRVSSVN